MLLLRNKVSKMFNNLLNFLQANQAKKTLYVKSQQLPRLNGKPVFLAINPLIGAPGPGRPPSGSAPRGGQQPPTGDQVAILVRPQKAAANSKPVLLNVPRKVALKVKVGTTLSFSASNDHKYVVMDAKIHPPVGARAPNRGPGRPPAQSPGVNILFYDHFAHIFCKVLQWLKYST